MDCSTVTFFFALVCFSGSPAALHCRIVYQYHCNIEWDYAPKDVHINILIDQLDGAVTCFALFDYR